jgi:hypothetical protein
MYEIVPCAYYGVIGGSHQGRGGERRTMCSGPRNLCRDGEQTARLLPDQAADAGYASALTRVAVMTGSGGDLRSAEGSSVIAPHAAVNQGPCLTS